MAIMKHPGSLANSQPGDGHVGTQTSITRPTCQNRPSEAPKKISPLPHFLLVLPGTQSACGDKS